MTPTRYRIVASDPNAHLFEVCCTVADPDPAGQAFRLPAWSPGSYLIREFARHFVSVRAECGGLPVAVRKVGKDVWLADACSGALTLAAEVYAFDPSVRAAYLDTTRAFFNGPSIFVWPVGREDRPCELEILPPAGEAYRDWRVATAMPRDGAEPFGFGRYRASNYDELIDHPVEMGRFDIVTFEAGAVPHTVAITGRHHADRERLAEDLARVCQEQIDLFGGAPASRAPVDNYLFQLLLADEGYGGLEHRASTSLVAKRDGLPQPGAAGVSDDYRSLLGLASHEYFHTWNVKRIKPAAFVPYDLTCETFTTQLWAFEGITSYYDDLMLVRSKVIGVGEYLELVGRQISALLRTPGRERQSVAESSFDAWIKYYRQDENAPNAIVSYYVKGALIALALDLELRLRSAVSLDDVMRALWQRHGQTGVGVPEDGMQALAAELSGLNLHAFFRDYVHGTVELPLPSLLQEFGIVWNLRPAANAKDRGGVPGKDPAPRVGLGATLATGTDLRLKHLAADGPAALAGLAPGDAIVAIDGLRASSDGLDRLVRARNAGDVVEIHAFRRDELMRFAVALAAARIDTCWLTLAETVGPEIAARREAWLGT
jgi:predicted metalloprotease with PDZ domain